MTDDSQKKEVWRWPTKQAWAALQKRLPHVEFIKPSVWKDKNKVSVAVRPEHVAAADAIIDEVETELKARRNHKLLIRIFVVEFRDDARLSGICITQADSKDAAKQNAQEKLPLDDKKGVDDWATLKINRVRTLLAWEKSYDDIYLDDFPHTGEIEILDIGT